MKYNHKKIEAKWQEYWQKNKTFCATEDKKKEKFYSLVEFPYPSGDGLHAGHLRSYTALDIVSRFKRMQGFEVLYPMGMDAFGLPTENYAIKNNITPQIATKKNIGNFQRQLKSLGYSFDWSRYLETTDADYYKWTQWIFIKMFENGLAYKAKEFINWCIDCKIGLANEEVVAGVCERCGGKVVKKEKEQWVLKITQYADRLIEDLDKIDFLPQIKKQQIDWIGKSEGVEIDFKLEDDLATIKVFTTRPDTLFGVTFMVISPEHPLLLLPNIRNKIKNYNEVSKYVQAASAKSDLERTAESKGKTGMELKGIKAINPANNEEIPIYVADYVLLTYGTGAIMAVPGHDQRDWEFAKKFNLAIREVISGGDISQGAYIGDGPAVNSGKYSGLSSDEFKQRIIAWLEKNNLGKKTINYKLRDWIFSRQRYWGEPIPMVNCKNCGWVSLPEEELPVKLPEIKDFEPTESGESPLDKLENWKNTICPNCSGQAMRETDVMPNWAGSNWYFVRYADPKNDKKIIDKNKAKYWLPVDLYNGGMEHTTLHLLYSRFVFKFLYDIGVIPREVGSEPYQKRTAQGMILGEGGIKMSKSKGNVISPDGYVKEHGADTIRVYEMFMGPFDQSIAWDDKGVIGISRFLNRVWKLQEKKSSDYQEDSYTQSLLHQSIKKISDDIESMRFNTAISQLMILTNAMEKQAKISNDFLEKFVLLLAPFAPHLAEEMWANFGYKKSLSHETWPQYNSELSKEDKVSIGIQVNGKVRDQVELPIDTEPSKEIEQQILEMPKIQKYLKGKQLVKFIHVKNKIISLVIK